MEIRAAEAGDVDGMQRVADRAWREAHESIVGEATVEVFLEEYYDAETFREHVESGESILLVAVEDDEVAGFALAGPTDADPETFGLSRIYVLPERWGEGIGRALLERIERAVADRNGERITLGVMAENERAVEFYEAAGYERTGEFYDERIDATAYTYEKRL